MGIWDVEVGVVDVMVEVVVVVDSLLLEDEKKYLVIDVLFVLGNGSNINGVLRKRGLLVVLENDNFKEWLNEGKDGRSEVQV